MLHQNDFIKLAEEIAESNEEIKWRGAASLAYYYAFHSVSILIKILPPAGDNEKTTHHPLAFIEIMKNHEDAKYRMIGILLHTCKDLRIRAFYHLTIPFSQEEAKLAIKLAEKIAEEVGLIYMYLILPGTSLHP